MSDSSRSPSPRPRQRMKGTTSYASDEDVAHRRQRRSPPPRAMGVPPPQPDPMGMMPNPGYPGGQTPIDIPGLPSGPASSGADNTPADLVKNITISRDTTAASNFKTEKLLALSNPTAVNAGFVPGRPPAPPSAQQDYQMQLMLLEQQNKKRLIAAQNGMPPQPMPANGYPPQVPVSYVPSAPGKKAKSKVHPQSQPSRGPPPPGMTPYNPNMLPPPPPPPGVPGGAQGIPLPFLPFPDTVVTEESRGRGDRDHMQRLLERIKLLEKENEELLEAQGTPKKPPRFQVFHCIKNDSKIYLEPPTWEPRSSGELEFYLKGHCPITSKSLYLQTHRDVAFYVEKVFDTTGLSEEQLKQIRGGGEIPLAVPDMETITLETDEMIDAAEEFEDTKPKFKDEFPEIRGWYNPIQAPYLFWYRYRSADAFEELLPRHQELMKLLTNWIEDNYLEEYKRADSMFESGYVTKESMKYFVAPGDVVVRKDSKGTFGGYLALSWVRPVSVTLTSKRADNADTGQGPKLPLDSYFTNVWKLAFDGAFYKSHASVEFELRAEKANDKIEISTLTSFPLRFASELVKIKLEQRGRTYWKCRDRRMVSYCPEGEDNALNGTGERFMVDYPTYKQLHRDSTISRPLAPRAYITEDVINMDSSPSKSPLIYLFPEIIVAFNLRKKKWEDLSSDRVRDVEWNKKAFEGLVIEPSVKEIVSALVTTQISAEMSTDLVANKGNGLILLLHGGPGTGKTLTAESVAETAERGLFRVSCGDIGTQAESVEKYLESVLHLGKIWGCVVLLDEADVFLEQRQLNDLQRNALVSVFLRVLEYYDGILILTSNRVGTFDEAFKSRIQLALHYEPLTRAQRSQIWTNFFERLKALGERNIDYVDVEGYVNILADHEMNGRQIRNSITTARQLAQFQKTDMSYRHLQHVITVAKKFDNHLSAGGRTPDDNGAMKDDIMSTTSKYTWADFRKVSLE